MRRIIPSTLLALTLLAPVGAFAAPQGETPAPSAPVAEPAAAAPTTPAPPVPAGGRRPPWAAQSIDQQLERLTAALELTPAQIAQMKVLLTQAEALRKRRLEEFAAKMKAVLTPEQQAKMAQMREQMSARGAGEPPPVPRHVPPDLGLTPKQMIEMRMLTNQHQHIMRADGETHLARTSTLLSPLQEKAYEQIVERRERPMSPASGRAGQGRKGPGGSPYEGGMPPHGDGPPPPTDGMAPPDGMMPPPPPPAGPEGGQP